MKIKDIKKKPDGTYAGMKFDKPTTDALTEYTKKHKIPNPIKPSKMHTTLLYSRKHLPKYKAAGKLDKPLMATFDKFEIFESNEDGDQTNCLVMRFKCDKLVDRHHELMDQHNAIFDYDEYKPHLTMSYDVGPMNPAHLPDFDGDISIVEEYGTNLDLSWASKNG